MIVTSFGVLFQLMSMIWKTLFYMASQLRSTSGWIFEFVCLRRKAIIIVQELWLVMIQNSPVWLLPMSWKNNEPLRIGILSGKFLDMLIHSCMHFFLQYGKWASTMGQIYRAGVSDKILIIFHLDWGILFVPWKIKINSFDCKTKVFFVRIRFF